jgi:hypothetical protein
MWLWVEALGLGALVILWALGAIFGVSLGWTIASDKLADKLDMDRGVAFLIPIGLCAPGLLIYAAGASFHDAWLARLAH